MLGEKKISLSLREAGYFKRKHLGQNLNVKKVLEGLQRKDLWKKIVGNTG